MFYDDRPRWKMRESRYPAKETAAKHERIVKEAGVVRPSTEKFGPKAWDSYVGGYFVCPGESEYLGEEPGTGRCEKSILKFAANSALKKLL
jgi:hypothetical protein